MIDFRIKRVSINHIGAFESLALEFQEKRQPGLADIHILTGENGTGKSTILQVISCISNTSKITPKVHHLHPGSKGFELQFEYRPHSPAEANQSKATQNFSSSFEQGRWINQITPSGGGPLTDYFNKWNQFSFSEFDFAIFAYSGYRRLDHARLQAIRELEENPLENSLDFANSVNPDQLLQWIANTKTKEALAYTRNDLVRFAQYQNAIKRIERVVSDITDWDVRFVLADNPLKVEVLVNGVALDFSLLPDGLKSIISWIADLLMRIDRIRWAEDADPLDRNFILLLDEIEVHLHPAWQRKVLPIIQKLFPNAQIILSSHSPFVTNSIDHAWIYKLKREGNASVPDGQPIVSENGKSYRTILEEIFGVDREFGVGVEKELDEFYDLKREILNQTRAVDDPRFTKLAADLSGQSVELESIIGMELQQIGRHLRRKPL